MQFVRSKAGQEDADKVMNLIFIKIAETLEDPRMFQDMLHFVETADIPPELRQFFSVNEEDKNKVMKVSNTINKITDTLPKKIEKLLTRAYWGIASGIIFSFSIALVGLLPSDSPWFIPIILLIPYPAGLFYISILILTIRDSRNYELIMSKLRMANNYQRLSEIADEI
jgi:hypothetical protein